MVVVKGSKRRLLATALPLLAAGCGWLSGLDDLQIVACPPHCDAAPLDGGHRPADHAEGGTADASNDAASPPSDGARSDGDAAPKDGALADGDAVALDVATNDVADVSDRDGGDGHSSDGGPTVDVGIDQGDAGGAVDASSDANLDASIDVGGNDIDAAVPCPGSEGPNPVRVGAYCIDATEVTNGHYKRFLASNPSTGGLPGVCAFKTSFVPLGGWPPPVDRDDSPVGYVDWCSAQAYCAWAGKRLCGAIGGGASSVDMAANKDVDQWFAACSAGGTRGFPYGGNAYMSGRCNDLELGIGAPLPVANRNMCVGGSPGIYDMDGNLWEWEDGCTGQSGAMDNCLIRGGSFAYSGATYGPCATHRGIERASGFVDVGFRCCGP
jgi:formylglycine-generating enzyme required for sulfatase activity